MRLHELSLEHMIPFLAMVADFRENDPAQFQQIFADEGPWDAGHFRRFIKKCESERLDWKPGPNRISKTRYVLLEDDGSVAGFGLMVFPLDDVSAIEGGNLRFRSPPSKRGGLCEVHTLNRMLFEAARAGMARVLVTCFEGDEVSRLAIEMNRGEKQDIVPGISDETKKVIRYWIPLR